MEIFLTYLLYALCFLIGSGIAYVVAKAKYPATSEEEVVADLDADYADGDLR